MEKNLNYGFIKPQEAGKKTSCLVSYVSNKFVLRIILMVGALPALLAYYWRTKMPETAQFTAFVAKNTDQAASDLSKVLQVEIETGPIKKHHVAKRIKNQFSFRNLENLEAASNGDIS
ncbi:hypothetical protein POM88_048887 [Heracleum sosnowskyi]|uniref:Uncharacterized protein n=1 Tax=Heracleum sosnowskyi TaxID=360622 RepID=A0AAD8GX66_9APIA|nr:hypothetical protein POM88_048887 [Heracleum sosnowskyi]